MSLRSLLLALRKIRVLYVDDPAATQEDLELYRQNTEAEFWTQASRLCADHPVDHDTGVPCQNCLFELTFFSHFPVACYDLIAGGEYDVFLVDIHADPVRRNVWNDSAYVDIPRRHKERLLAIFPSLKEGECLDGNHVIRLIARLRHKIPLPFVAWTSFVEEPVKSFDLNLGVVASVSHKEAANLKWLLVSAVHWVAPQIVEGFRVPPPDDGGLSPRKPVIVDFKKGAMEIASGVPIEMSSGNSVTIEPAGPGIDRLSIPLELSVTRGWPFRFLMRGGRLSESVKQDLQVSLSRLFKDAPLKKLKTEHVGLQGLLDDFSRHLEVNSQRTLYWDRSRGLRIETTMDAAWRFLYHAVARLFRNELDVGIDLAEFDGSPLAFDSKLVSSLGCLAVAREYAERAIDIGTDSVAVATTDIEYLWVAPLVKAAVTEDVNGIATLADDLVRLVVAGRGEALDERRRMALMYPWLQCDEVFRLRKAAQDVAGGSGTMGDLRVEIFRTYKDGWSLHARLKELAVRPADGVTE